MAEDKKSEINRKPNPNNIPPTGDDNTSKNKNRFNIYWVYGLVFAAIVGYNLFRGASSTGVETDQIQFTELVKHGDVEKIKTIRNKKIVRVFIMKDSLERSQSDFRKILDKQYDNAIKMPPPQLYFSIVDDKTFAAQMQEFYKMNPSLRQVPDQPDDEGELFGQILTTLLPILLIGLLFIMMMRKVGGPGGGSGGPGGIFNIGKSKATLFDKASRVNINFG
ncbi:MAG: AAA family ATPase, partial [Ferruginibacter sp.]